MRKKYGSNRRGGYKSHGKKSLRTYTMRRGGIKL